MTPLFTPSMPGRALTQIKKLARNLLESMAVGAGVFVALMSLFVLGFAVLILVGMLVWTVGGLG